METVRAVLAAFWAALPGNAEFWAGIFGTVVGGVLTLLGQRQEAKRAKAERAEDRKAEQEANAYSLLFKVLKVHALLDGLHSHMEEPFVGEKPRAAEAPEPWQFYLPLANVPDRVEFSAQEMSLLLAIQEDEVFNDLMNLELKYNSTLDGLTTLNLERSQLADMLKPQEMEGNQASSYLTKEQVLALRPRMVAVNGLFEHLRESTKRDFALADSVLHRMHDGFRRKLGIKQKLQVSREGAPDRPADKLQG
ncbi:hypothetical protein [Salinarimonas soli]|uniref:Uncharacterized protein n=1 Tax=Salinarimonas soli TaxID=1638099 RepID=A0A5B2VDV1_9HYPH|nr:hypothetical protein [Salinarimonas soli]KAA2236955.1 hypothetical protein F0L46_11830 [Salinarimonas soli]